MAYSLALAQLAGNLNIHPNKVFTSSEVTTPAMREVTEKVWGKVVFDEYAATETATIAAECSHHHGLHLFEDLLIIENVDESNRPVPAGVFGDKLLVTTLFNRTQPLIRYEVSDRVKISPEESSCDLAAYRTIQEVEGRREDILVMAGKGQNQVQLHPNVFNDLLDTIPNKGWQIIQQKDGSLRVLLVEGDQILAEKAVGDQLVRILAGRGVESPQIKVRVDKVMAIPKAKSGKSPLIKAYRPGSEPGPGQE
jgi:phenylacetate-CoA ligase